MHRVRKWLVAGVLLPASVLAQESGNTGTVGDAVSQLQTAATSAIDEVKPALIAVIVALFAIVGIVFAWNKLKARFGR